MSPEGPAFRAPGTCLSAGGAARRGAARLPGSAPARFPRLPPPPLRRAGFAAPAPVVTRSLASQVSGAGGEGAARSRAGGRHEAFSAAALPVAGEGGRLQLLPGRRLRGGCRLRRLAGCLQGACGGERRKWGCRGLGGRCGCEGTASGQPSLPEAPSGARDWGSCERVGTRRGEDGGGSGRECVGTLEAAVQAWRPRDLFFPEATFSSLICGSVRGGGQAGSCTGRGT